ncbi:MAG TPA: malate synthase A, partial [Flavobacteriales bacterium]|nr:malate synthase A [Flavobacteriales bacterium]
MPRVKKLNGVNYIDHELASSVLTEEAVSFLAELVQRFGSELMDLLSSRRDRQTGSKRNVGYLPDSLEIREGHWRVAPTPPELIDRRVEITGPPDRKMIINALNSGAKVYMADFEDSLSPTWKALLEGQLNLVDALSGHITYEHPTKGTYELNNDPAVLFVRPRGLHLR